MRSTMSYKYSRQHFKQHFQFVAIALLFKTIVLPVFLADAQAQTFEPPAGNPAPTITLGGGRRGNDGQCSTDKSDSGKSIKETDSKTKETLEQQLSPLLPSGRLGLTVASNPKFFAYIPKTTAIAVEFIIENEQGKGIARKRVDLTTTPSIVSVQFEKTPLEVGKHYKWLISVVCQNGDPEDSFSEGIVRRIQPPSTLLAKLEKASAIEQVYIYAKSGIWHEAIADLANLRLAQPDNAELKAIWLNLLKSSSLESVATAPFNQP